MSPTTQAVETLDKTLLLAEMAASLAARWTTVNTLLAKIQVENRQPTEEEFQAVYDDYARARAKLLGDADLVDQVTGTAADHPG